MFISSNIGFMKISANPMVTLGLAVICTFCPTYSDSGSGLWHLLVVQFIALSVGGAVGGEQCIF